MGMNDYAFVDFEQYCKWCIHFSERDEYGTTCHECLCKPARMYSHIPENFTVNPDYKPNAFERTLALFKNK